jgi:hypothetical protein
MQDANTILARAREREEARAARNRRRPIDYERMSREFPKQKAALTRALKSGQRDRVVLTCAATVKAWDEIGAWPDDWARWQRALDDVFPVFQAPNLEDLLDMIAKTAGELARRYSGYTTADD